VNASGATPRPLQRAGGALIAAIGIGATIWLWQQHGHASLRGALIFPAFAVVGLALIAFPGYRDERLARAEDLSQLSGTKLITPRWWGVLVVALVAGGADAALLGVFAR